MTGPCKLGTTEHPMVTLFPSHLVVPKWNPLPTASEDGGIFVDYCLSFCCRPNIETCCAVTTSIGQFSNSNRDDMLSPDIVHKIPCFLLCAPLDPAVQIFALLDK